MMSAGFQWSPLLGAYSGPINKVGDKTVGLVRPAAGVPPGFHDKKKARADKADKAEKMKQKEKEALTAAPKMESGTTTTVI
jgi:hypothetical protein